MTREDTVPPQPLSTQSSPLPHANGPTGVTTFQSLVDCERDEEFWFDDGNIVLIAGNLSFKVYRGLLASQSPVFADMFSTGDPHADSQIDGCPIVHLQDTPQALRHLLRALIPSRERR